jgi:Fe-S-cluster-containing dehydrogenase component
MTALPAQAPAKKLGLVIDLDICVGCHACAVNCKEWNTGGHSAPLPDSNPYGHDPSGVWFNRIHSFEVETDDPAGGRTVHFPKSCLHCDDAPCVTVCPTGASYKRSDDGIVLVNPDTCIGCKLCSWACPYGAREYDEDAGVMKKCTLCVDRIYNSELPADMRVPACVSTCPVGARSFGDLGDPESDVSKLVAARAGYDLMPEQGCKPTNKYLPPRPRAHLAGAQSGPQPEPQAENALPDNAGLVARWVDRILSL